MMGTIKAAYHKSRKMSHARKPLQLPPAETFVIEPDQKAQAMKVLEEAAELLEAIKRGRDDLALEEAMDVYQALANLIELKGWTHAQIVAAYARVKVRNKQRGRYRGR